MSNEKIVPGHKYTLILNGLFGRNRKPKIDYVPLVEFTENVIDDSTLAKLTDAKLAGIKLKPGCTWQVDHTDVTREDLGDGLVIMSLKITLGTRDTRLTGTKE